MHSNVQKFLILLTLLFAFSCSQKKAGVRLEVSNNFVFGGSGTAAIAAGGLMVWGRSSTGEAFGQSLEDKDQINLQLNPGSWTFYAMAWDGTTAYNGSAATNIALGGKPRCAKSPVTKLESEPVAVELVLDNDKCDDSSFSGTIGTTSDPLGYKVLPKLKLNFCSQVGNDITGPTKKCADTKDDPNRVYGKGAVSSYRVTLRNFTGPASNRNLLPGGVKGECAVFTGDNEGGPEAAALYGAATSAIPGLPAGGLGHPFHLTVEMFPGNQYCDAPGAGNRGVITKELVNGVTFTDNTTNKYFPEGFNHRQYVEVSPAKICSTRSGVYSDHPFAGGDGSIDRPYLLCSVPQFYEINTFVDQNSDTFNDYFSKSFKLQANLDFNPYSNGLAGISPALFRCLELGTNFIPIGYTNTSCNPPDDPIDPNMFNWSMEDAFTGSFFGSGFKLSNLRIRAEYKEFLGLFANFQGAYLTDLILDRTEISGRSTVGALAGSVSNSAKISNIVGHKLDIEARDSGATSSSVGSIFGVASDVTINNIKVVNSKVRGEASDIGGIIGVGAMLNASKISSEVDIEANSPATQVNIGGVFGTVGDSTLSFLKHEGGIYTDATYVGGLIGNMVNTSLTDFYTISHVQSYTNATDSKIGGVIGYASTSSVPTNYGRGYSLSSIRTNCTVGSCTQGPIIGKSAFSPVPTYFTVYKLNNTETGEGSNPGGVGTEILTSLADIKSANASLLPDLISETGWVHSAGQYPRFLFEEHPCMLPGFSNSGDGSSSNPFKICNEDQYMNNSGNAVHAGKYFRLMGNIRLPNSNTGQFEILDFRTNLLGNNKSLIAGNSDAPSSMQTGHIYNLHGSIRNLKIHGMSRSSGASDPSAPNGVFVANNFGLLQDISAWTYSSWDSHGSGFVGINKDNGTKKGIIRDVYLDGIVSGQFDFASLSIINEGTIESSEVSGELHCKMDGCFNIAGLVSQNSGSISKTSVEIRLPEFPGKAAGASMLVLTNSTGGTITDVGISPHSEYRLGPAGNGYYFHAANSGTLTRVVNHGRIIDVDNTYASGINTPANAGTGTHDGVLRTGGRSGKLLLESADFLCTSSNTLSVTGWSGITDAVTWNGTFQTNYFASGDGDKMLFIEATYETIGGKFSQRVSDFSASGTFTLMAPECQSGEEGKVNIWYTNDLSVAANGAPLTGVILPQFASDKNQYLPPATWNGQIWDPYYSLTDLNEMMAYFRYVLGVSPVAVGPKAWELDDEGINLFERN